MKPPGSASAHARSKYGVRTDAIGKAARTWRGVVYRSLVEYRCARRLDLMVSRGAKFSWFPEPDPWQLVIKGASVGSYRPDFELSWRCGGRVEYEWIEVKGMRVRDWVLREKVVRALYPDRKLTVVYSVDDLEQWLKGRRAGNP